VAFFSDAPLEAARVAQVLSTAAGAPELPGAVVRMVCCDKAERR
jgi:hypothetical protein